MQNDENTSIEAIKHEETIEKFIQVIAKNMNLYGITSSVGRLYGVLYFSDEPMTLDDMRNALEMSKTSMSTGVRTLSDMKMVESTFRRGIRKDLYQSEEDWYKSFTSCLPIAGAIIQRQILKRLMRQYGNCGSSHGKQIIRSSATGLNVISTDWNMQRTIISG